MTLASRLYLSLLLLAVAATAAAQNAPYVTRHISAAKPQTSYITYYETFSGDSSNEYSTSTGIALGGKQNTNAAERFTPAVTGAISDIEIATAYTAPVSTGVPGFSAFGQLKLVRDKNGAPSPLASDVLFTGLWDTTTPLGSPCCNIEDITFYTPSIVIDQGSYYWIVLDESSSCYNYDCGVWLNNSLSLTGTIATQFGNSGNWKVTTGMLPVIGIYGIQSQ